LKRQVRNGHPEFARFDIGAMKSIIRLEDTLMLSWVFLVDAVDVSGICKGFRRIEGQEQAGSD